MKKLKLKVGDYAKVVKAGNHKFPVGEKVKIIRKNNKAITPYYIAKSKVGFV